MASSSTWAQYVITCELCENPTQLFCNDCQVSLCGGCIYKHVDNLKSQTHDMVSFTDREERLVFPLCASHPKQRCEGQCQQCNVPVCFKCLTAYHSGHTVVDMADIIKQSKEIIEKETGEIETFMSKFNLGEAKMDQRISKLLEQFENLEREGENLRKTWHEEVDNIFNTLQSTIRTMKDNRLKALKSHQSLLKNSGTKLALIMKENKNILKSNKVTDVTSYKSQVKEFMEIHTDVDVTIPSLKSQTVKGSDLSLELAEYKATLRQTSLSNLTDEESFLFVKQILENVEVIASIPSEMKPLGSVICVETNEAWVCSSDKTLKRIDIHGSVKDMITAACETFPNDISVTREGELIYSDANSRTVNIFRQGRIETLFTLPEGWHAWGLCCTRSGDILVSMCTRDQSHYKIVRFQGQTATQEIYKDEHEQQIFRGGKIGVNVGENNNEDICASDSDANTVIVVDKTGRVRFRYDGTPARRNRQFQPMHIVTDALSQIIINDINNDCLHILDQNGQLLKCVDNCSLERPCGLSVDSEGRLWVGSYYTGIVKVIQYME
ncbi:E3 ubiquitin-protein ligase TRIM71-like [Saccostrea echinata]|uniref:E3 ubiquitin-protein ligase TRIM71-like n=1 Tax=Saccostrea echinata TaxID=191078 RepID=UPI002A83AEAF|nr:E3 ubiquitin-protein ligase TRIM71-like [Saccostrea echinata]